MYRSGMDERAGEGGGGLGTKKEKFGGVFTLLQTFTPSVTSFKVSIAKLFLPAWMVMLRSLVLNEPLYIQTCGQELKPQDL